MRTGRVTQTIWNRSVKKQIQKVNRNSTGKTAWEESSSELISDEKDFVWSSTSVSGKAPAQVKYAVIKSAGDLAARESDQQRFQYRFCFLKVLTSRN